MGMAVGVFFCITDWKNVEMTGYVKVNSGQSGENFA